MLPICQGPGLALAFVGTPENSATTFPVCPRSGRPPGVLMLGHIPGWAEMDGGWVSAPLPGQQTWPSLRRPLWAEPGIPLPLGSC